jgi:hypothetical protein
MRLLTIVLILMLTLAACVPVPAAPTLPDARGLQPTEVNNLRVRQTLEVAGTSTFAAMSPTSLTVSGATALHGGLTMEIPAVFAVENASGNTTIAGTLAIGGGFGATGCSVSTAGVLQCDGAATIGGAAVITGAQTLIGATAANGGLTVGGGFGDTGCTLSTAGVLQCNDAATIGGAATITGATTLIGSLAADGGITVDTSNFTVNGTTGAVSTASSLSALSATVGGGFGAAGCTVGADGAVSCDGAAILGSTALITGVLTTIAGANVGGALTVGGGFGTAGCTIGADGALSCDGAVILGSTATITGVTTIVGDLIPTSIKPSLTGSAAANNYCMSADCDTGMWYPGDNIIGIATGGAERARVTNAGLTVVGAVDANGGLTVDTSAFTVADATGNTVISGTLTVGGVRSVWGSSTITGTGTATHGLTTPLYALCSIGNAVQTTAEATCSIVITGSTVTLNTWDALTGLTPGTAGALVYWQVAGTP